MESTAIESLTPGTVLACFGTAFDSRIIEAWTHGPSHVAFVAQVAIGDLAGRTNLHVDPQVLQSWRPQPLVFESTSISNMPCCLQGKMANGCQAHGWREYVEKYDGKIWMLEPIPELTAEESAALTNAALSAIGRSYDKRGCLRAGTGHGWRALMNRFCWWRTYARDTQYCVEYCGDCQCQSMPTKMPKFNPGTMDPGEFIHFLLTSPAPYRNCVQAK